MRRPTPSEWLKSFSMRRATPGEWLKLLSPTLNVLQCHQWAVSGLHRICQLDAVMQGWCSIGDNVMRTACQRFLLCKCARHCPSVRHTHVFGKFMSLHDRADFNVRSWNLALNPFTICVIFQWLASRLPTFSIAVPKRLMSLGPLPSRLHQSALAHALDNLLHTRSNVQSYATLREVESKAGDAQHYTTRIQSHMCLTLNIW